MPYAATFLYYQWFVTPSLPSKTFEGQTIIVTGANSGLGLEAARHFTNLKAKKIIIACRTLSKGEAAKESIQKSSGRTGVIEVWKLDLGSFASVKAFVRQCQTLDRLDAIVENAGISTDNWEIAEGNESTITTNVTSTLLLALMILPKLRESADKYGIQPHLSIVSSEVHYWQSMRKETNEPSILAYTRDQSKANMGFHRYSLSKMLEILYCRQLAEKMDAVNKSPVVLNFLNPGLCWSGLTSGGLGETIVKTLLARKTDVGARTLVSAVVADKDSHGQYMTNGLVHEPSSYVLSKEGRDMGKRFFAELNEELERIEPGVTDNI